MKKILKELFRINKSYLLEYKYRNEINHVSGLTLTEKKRLKEDLPYDSGSAVFFEKPFFFVNGMSLLHSIEEIFEDHIYRFAADNNSPYIIDCGANMGLSIYYFKKMYPDSKILAFEPDDAIFEMLQKNLEFIPSNQDIEIRKEAVWTKDTYLDFFSEGGLAGSFSVDFSGKNNVQKTKAVDLKKYLNEKVDFLKIDIEGAENELIFDIKDHIHNVQRMFLEYHGITGEQQNLGEILNLLKEEGFQYYIRTADDIMKYPFTDDIPKPFDQQLNIFCFRI